MTSQLSRSEAARLLLHRRTVRTDLTSWCVEALAPYEQVPAAHHRLIIKELEGVANGSVKRLMLHMPPGSAKSTYASVLFPAWLMAQRPNLNVIGASNTATLAESFSRRVMRVIRDNSATLGMSLGRESAEMWDTSNGATYRAAGVGGIITGLRCDVAIIDDPTKSRAEAESEVVRETQWNWFTGDLRTRLKPDASIITIMTRWHQDDIGGRLLERQPGLWRVVSLPAIAGDDDPMGRAPGDWLWDDDAYGYAGALREVHNEYMAAGATRDWQSLYQQEPRAAEGSMFRIGQIRTIPAEPVVQEWVRAWDLAASAESGLRDADYTAGVKLGRTSIGRYVIGDMVRLRGTPDEVRATILNTAGRDGKHVRIGIPQDPGQAGKAQVLDLTRLLAGWRVESSPETGDKATRASPFASQVNVENVDIVSDRDANGNFTTKPWNAVLLDEMAAFPNGTKDDQIDCLSRGFAMVGLGPKPMRISAEGMRRL